MDLSKQGGVVYRNSCEAGRSMHKRIWEHEMDIFDSYYNLHRFDEKGGDARRFA